MSLLGTNVPTFNAPAVVNGKEIVENFSLEHFIGEKYIVLFFYPADFTFICPTEILKFQEYLPEFEKRKTAVVGCSTDSQYSHLRWLKMTKEEGGIQGVTFPLISDQTLTISTNFGVLSGAFNYNERGESFFDGLPVAFRATFIIDRQGIIRYETINDLNIGRSVEEILRTLYAIQHYEKTGELCPADWKKDNKAIKPNFEDFTKFLKEQK